MNSKAAEHRNRLEADIESYVDRYNQAPLGVFGREGLSTRDTDRFVASRGALHLLANLPGVRQAYERYSAGSVDDDSEDDE